MPSPAPSQRRAFLDVEGDAYFERNRERHRDLEVAAAHDPLLAAYRELDLRPASALEIGASDGWRLECLRRAWGPAAHLAGVDPSARAVAAGRERDRSLDLRVGTAEALPFADGAFELVAFGFCLYLCDRADLFRIAAEADRVLAEGGTLALFDFEAEAPYRNPYGPRDGLASYKFAVRRLFDWNPAYTVRHHAVFPHPGPDGRPPARWTDDDLLAVTLLAKDTAGGWPARGAGDAR